MSTERPNLLAHVRINRVTLEHRGGRCPRQWLYEIRLHGPRPSGLAPWGRTTEGEALLYTSTTGLHAARALAKLAGLPVVETWRR